MNILRIISMRRKTVVFLESSDKEYLKIPKPIRRYFRAIMLELEIHGNLGEPEVKKIRGYYNLYEMRVKSNGSWRGLFSYINNNRILLLTFFQKKTNKTPRHLLEKAYKRSKSVEL